MQPVGGVSRSESLLSKASFSDATEQETGLPGWQQRYTKLNRGPFQGSVTRLVLPGVTVIGERAVGVLHMESCPPPGTFAVCLPAHVGPTRINGVSVAPFVYQSAGTSIDGSQDGAGEAITLQIDAVRLPESVRALGTGLMLAELSASSALLRRWALSVVGAFSRHAEPSREVVERVGGAMVARVLDGLEDLHATCCLKPLKLTHCYELYRRVTALVEREDYEVHDVAALARRLSVPDFIIRAAFKEVLGVPPRLWLQQRRLASAHRSLRAGSERHRTIAEIALNSGFNHVSRFSHYYERTYGRLPSQSRH